MQGTAGEIASPSAGSRFSSVRQFRRISREIAPQKEDNVRFLASPGGEKPVLEIQNERCVVFCRVARDQLTLAVAKVVCTAKSWQEIAIKKNIYIFK